jgi:type I restriction enzyme, S subunit
MPSEWEELTISDVCDVFDGPHATPEKTLVGPVFLGITSLNRGRLDLSGVARLSEWDFVKWTRRVTPRSGDLVFSYETKLGEAALVPKGLRCCLGRRMGLLRPKSKKVDSRFLLYYYLGPEFQELIRERTIHGSTVERLSIAEFPDFPIRLPSPSEQKRIAHILGTLDDKIELNRRMNATLEAMARALFQSWFVDFDPVRRNAEGRESRPEDTLFPDSFEESEIGEVPSGWRVCPMSEVIEVNPKRVLKKGSVAPYLDMKNLPTQGHSADEVIQREFTSGTKFQNGDTLLARITPCLENGKTGFVDFLEEGQIGWGSTEFIVFAPGPPLPPQFGYLLARSDSLRAHAIQNMVGTSGRQRVPYECFDNYLIAVPSSGIAARFAEVTSPLMAKIKANSTESRTLAALRETLLPKLLSGEILLRGESVADARDKVVAFPDTEAAGTSRKATEEFVEAIIISQLVRKLATPDYPLGRKRYNKLAYLAHRKSEDDIAKRYLKKAAGPYSPWAKYGGPEKIAVRNGYVVKASSGKFEGLVAGEQIDKIDLYLPKYPVCAALDWVISEFRYRKNDELELLATVDFAALDLLKAGQAATCEAVRDLIANNQEWAPKLKREIFSDEGISGALEQLQRHFPATYGSPS